jgi:hypothetical protein
MNIMRHYGIYMAFLGISLFMSGIYMGFRDVFSRSHPGLDAGISMRWTAACEHLLGIMDWLLVWNMNGL